MRKAEIVLEVLKDTLVALALPNSTVLRNPTEEVVVPSGGLLVLRDGDPGEPEVSYSPLTYAYEHTAQLEVFYQDGTAAERDAGFDALLQWLGRALLADTTLGGAVDYVVAAAPEPIDEDVFGGDPVKGAIVPISLLYTTENPLL